jgi:hypothetical protein
MVGRQRQELFTKKRVCGVALNLIGLEPKQRAQPAAGHRSDGQCRPAIPLSRGLPADDDIQRKIR